MLRPVMVPATTTATMGVEVARERFRVEAAEDIGVAQDAAKHGELARAAQIPKRRQEAAAELAGGDECLRERSADRRQYEQSGAGVQSRMTPASETHIRGGGGGGGGSPVQQRVQVRGQLRRSVLRFATSPRRQYNTEQH
jgi:hypothetical protein